VNYANFWNNSVGGSAVLHSQYEKLTISYCVFAGTITRPDNPHPDIWVENPKVCSISDSWLNISGGEACTTQNIVAATGGTHEIIHLNTELCYGWTGPLRTPSRTHATGTPSTVFQASSAPKQTNDVKSERPLNSGNFLPSEMSVMSPHMSVSAVLIDNTENFLDTAPQKSRSALGTMYILRSNVFKDTGPSEVSMIVSESSVFDATLDYEVSMIVSESSVFDTTLDYEVSMIVSESFAFDTTLDYEDSIGMRHSDFYVNSVRILRVTAFFVQSFVSPLSRFLFPESSNFLESCGSRSSSIFASPAIVGSVVFNETIISEVSKLVTPSEVVIDTSEYEISNEKQVSALFTFLKTGGFSEGSSKIVISDIHDQSEFVDMKSFRFSVSGRIFGGSIDFLDSRSSEDSLGFFKSFIVLSDSFGDSFTIAGSLVVRMTMTVVHGLNAKSSSLSTGAIVGIVIGVLLLVCLIGIIGYVSVKKGSQENEGESVESNGAVSHLDIEEVEALDETGTLKVESEAFSGEDDDVTQ
jgi:hypothetical protein